MIRGMYTAGSAMLTQSRRLDIIGDNMSNSRTAGFKKDQAVATVFNERSLEGNRGTINLGQTIESVSTDFTQGTVKESGNSNDLAIEGEGFFSIQQADGSVQYTRNGRFMIDAEGYITSPDGGRLMGAKGAINTGKKPFEVTADGSVTVDGKTLDKLAIYNPANTDMMTKTSAGFFTASAGSGQKPFTGQIKQGAYEASNSNVMEEMIDMMSSQRSYQACSQVVKMIDSTLSKSVDLGRMS